MVNAHIAWYLFLAGMGGGAFFVGALVDLALRVRPSDLLENVATVTDRGLVFGPLAVAVGLVFLLSDLGSPERAFSLFLSPPNGILGWGAWGIALFLATSVAAYLLGTFDRPQMLRVFETVCQVAATVLAAVVVTYSGVYLSLFPTVPFLNTPLVPVLFVISALSTGTAYVLVCSFMLGGLDPYGRGLETCIKAELALIAADLTALAAFLLVSWFTNQQARLSVAALVGGEFATLFWLGVLCVGLVAPLLLGAHHRLHPGSPSFALGAGCSVLGGLCLRYALLQAALRFSAFGMEAVAFWG